MKDVLIGFNHCFIGTYSITPLVIWGGNNTEESFNPCFIGTYSITCYFYSKLLFFCFVLILVLLELTLLPFNTLPSDVIGIEF